MKIAQVAPLYESVPPHGYGGTERVVSYLTEELVARGHEVTLFATGDSVTSARLEAAWPRSLRLDPSCADRLAPHLVMLERVFERAAEFDLVHFHCDYLHYPVSTRLRLSALTTLHGRLDLPELQHLYRRFASVPVVSISNAQRGPVPWANWLGTVYHGLPPDLFRLHEARGRYLVFVGRLSPEKRVDRAIEIARRVGLPIKVAAKIDPSDHEYFETVAKPLLKDPIVDFLGEVGDGEKEELLGNAYALIFPIDWPEPFGLVMIEAMACGTPIVAYRGGSVEEVMEDGVTGFVVRDLNDAVTAVENVERLSRRACRGVFEERFTSERMAEHYEALYRQVAHTEPAASIRR